MNNTFCQPLDVSSIQNNDTLTSWIEENAKKYQLKYLLAHADDGIIWGRFDTTEKLMTAHESFPQFPELRLITLQQGRIFGEQSEVLIWKTDESLKARSVQDPSEYEHFPEEQILWGTHAEKEDKKNSFTLLADGFQGLRHAVPLTNIKFSKEQKRLIRLVVHHYYKYDKCTGLARVFLSRLVDLK
jgi:CRISPR-associated protein (TIGR03984 family)